MTPIDHGRIAARAIGTLFLLGGLVMLIDFTVHLQQSKQAMSDFGWGNYGPLEERKDDGPFTTFLHDTYYVITPTVSPFGSGGFILIGSAFLIFSRLIGRIIAGVPRPQNQGEQPGL